MNSDLEGKIQSPARCYGAPQDVLSDETLTADEKRRVLESWRQDATRMSESEAENMTGGERNLVGEVSLALLRLEEEHARARP
jgi:hypothetical protein